MRVEFLYWDGCPSHPQALRELKAAMSELGLEPDAVEVREIDTDDAANAERFTGSPTIRVDGRDIDASGAKARPALTCRIYHLADGRASPIPSREQLEEALT